MSNPVEIDIDDLAQTGEGVGKHEGAAVFVSGALAGERIIAAIDKTSPRRGLLLRVVSPSAERVVAPCPHADSCGGCDFMHLSQPAQERWHVSHVLAALGGVPGALKLPAPTFHRPLPPLGYRTRARLHVRSAGGVSPGGRSPETDLRRAEVGYLRARSHRVAPVAACLALAPPLAPAIAELGQLFGPSRGHGQAQVALGREGRRVYEIDWRGAIEPESLVRFDAAVASGAVAGARIWPAGAREPLRFGDPRPVVAGVDGAPLFTPPGGFSQASDAGGAALARRVAQIAAEARADRAIELFAGSGTLTIALARQVGSLTAVERDAAACDCLRENLRARGLAVRVRCGDAENAELPRADLVVLDPPRGGAAGAVRVIARARPKRAIYVSCNASTLARDLSALARAGYRLTSLDVFDLFPQTSHVEAIAALER